MNGKELVEAIQKIPDWEIREIVYDDYENGREIVESIEETTFQRWEYINKENYKTIVLAIKLG